MARFFMPASGESAYDIPLEVVNLLARLNDEYTVFLNAQFKRQADIIIFTKHAAHVIEVKDKRGTIVVGQDGKWYVDGEPIVNLFAGNEENPLTQAQKTADAFEKELKRIYQRRRKKFNGKVAPYVLVPFASEASRSNLSQIWGWVWILTSYNDLPNAIGKRDKDATVDRDFAFAPEDIDLIAQALGMKPVYEINGVRIFGRDYTSGEVGSTPHPATHQQQSGDHPRRDTSKREQIQPRHTTALAAFLSISALIGAIGLCVLLAIAFSLWEIGSNRESLSPPPATGDVPSSIITPSPAASVPSAVPSQAIISTPTEQPPSLSLVPEPSPITGEWSASRNGLVLTVERIEIGANSFRIWMKATNSTNEVLFLPLFGYFFVVDNLGNQYEAVPFSSTFPIQVAPGATISGFAEMSRRLDDDATSITVTFTKVFGSLSIDSISVEDIPIP